MLRPVTLRAVVLAGLVVGLTACDDSSNSSAELGEDQTVPSGQSQVADGTSEVVSDGADSKPEEMREGFSEAPAAFDQYAGSSDASFPIAQISIEMDAGLNPDEFPYV